MSRNKNFSKNVPNGTVLRTRDEYFHGSGSYRKPGYERRGHYRAAVVVDSNRSDELAVVKLHGKSGTPVPGYKKGKSHYKPYVETKDDKGMPIKTGRKFLYDRTSTRVPIPEVNKIKKDCYSRPVNRYLLRKLKGRGKKRGGV